MGWESQSNSILNTADVQNWYEGSKGNGFLTGGVLTSADVDRETDYSAFTAKADGTLIVVAASSVTHDAGDASDPRIDIVEVNSSGTVAIVKGTATTENSTTQPRPPAPTLTAGSLMLAMVYVPASASTILDANIFDRRVERNDTTTVSAIPRALSALGDAAGTNQMATNTVGSGGTIVLEAQITVSKFTFEVTAVGTGGTVNFAIFSEDGQTRHIDGTTASISGTGHVTTTLGTAVILPAGPYYVFLQPTSTADITVATWAVHILATTQVGSEPVHSGDETMSAGTMDSTFTPTSVTPAADSVPTIQLDA